MSTTGSTSRPVAVPSTTPTDEQVTPVRGSTRFAAGNCLVHLDTNS